MQNLPRPCVRAGMMFMLVIGAVHLLMLRHAFDDAGYKGVLFLIGVIAAFFAAMGIQESALIRGWVLGTLVAGATIIGFIADGATGLPGLPADSQTWQQPMGIIALVAESLMLVIAFWAYLAARHTRYSIAV